MLPRPPTPRRRPVAAVAAFTLQRVNSREPEPSRVFIVHDHTLWELYDLR